MHGKRKPLSQNLNRREIGSKDKTLYAVLSGYITTLKDKQKLDVSSEGPS